MASYPILEYDSSPRAVLQPDHENLDLHLPPCVAFPFVGGLVDAYAREHDLPVLANFNMITGALPVYRVSENTCLAQAPFGAPAAVAFMDWMIAYGAKRIVTAGSCGALIDLPENTFIVPSRALRDEGTSYHYINPGRWAYPDSAMQRRIMDALDAAGERYVDTDTWTTDAIYRETIDKVRRSRSEGCGVVDMECAALCCCAEFRCVEFGEFLFTADSLADADAYDERDWGAASLKPALELCLKVAGETYRDPWETNV